MIPYDDGNNCDPQEISLDSGLEETICDHQVKLIKPFSLIYMPCILSLMMVYRFFKKKHETEMWKLLRNI